MMPCNKLAENYKDSRDRGHAMEVISGNFYGGDFCVPEAGQQLKLQPRVL